MGFSSPKFENKAQEFGYTKIFESLKSNPRFLEITREITHGPRILDI